LSFESGIAARRAIGKGALLFAGMVSARKKESGISQRGNEFGMVPANGKQGAFLHRSAASHYGELTLSFKRRAAL